ncbi:TetR/AcrR family transcriptional regulator [Gordonia sp. VNK21]|uniref:TetR/AcrR family transcriptional regulator n=1 Tax=Gordonia sp. VNK21 TaxID=3382483 RepID=UPI0038D4F437
MQVAASAFSRRGYQQITLKDIAAGAGISAPALYKHFTGKGEILQAVIDSELTDVCHVVTQAGQPGASDADFAERLAQSAVEHRDLWIIVHRDLQNLSDDAQAATRAQLRTIQETIRHHLAVSRPDAGPDDLDLRARAAVACLAAPSEYPQKNTDTALIRNIAAAVSTIFTLHRRTDPAPDMRTAPLPPFQPQVSRRERLLVAAAQLFAMHGYDAVSLADIGEAVGMSGPSIYSHFDTKSEILETLMRRAVGWIEFDRGLAFSESTDPAEVVTIWLHRYAQMAISHHSLFVIYTNEGPHLPDSDRRWVERSHRDYVQSWATLIADVRGCKDVSARILASCALSIINELSGHPRAPAEPGYGEVLANLTADLVRSTSTSP